MNDETKVALETVPNVWYVQMQAPGIAYSVIHLSLPADDALAEATVQRAVWLAKVLKDEYDATFYPPFIETQQGGSAGPRVQVLHNGNVNIAPTPDEQYAPSEPVRVPLDAHGNEQSHGSGAGDAVAFYCPEHNVEVKPSVRNKTMEFDADLGYEIAASWFHTLPDGKTHSVWRSKLGKRVATGASR